MPKIVESIVVPHPEPYERRTASPRVADLLAGLAVFLPGYRSPGHYRRLMSEKGYTLMQRETEVNGVKGITIWVKELKP